MARNFSIQHFFIVILLMLILCDYAGLGYLLTPVLFFCLLSQRSLISFLDSQVVWLLLFSIMYCAIGWLSDNDSFSGARYVQYLFLPSLCYLSGRLIVRSNISEDIIIKLIFLFCVSLGIIALLSVGLNIINNGFVGDSRNMPLIGMSASSDMSATGINARLSMLLMFIGLIFANSKSAMQTKYKVIAIWMSILAIISAVRLGSRTGLVIVFASIILCFLINSKQYSRFKIILFLSCSIGVGMLIMYFIDNNDNLLSFYMDRMDNEEFGTNTMGGRTQRWTYYVSQIINYPLGRIPDMPGIPGSYAHNLWLDVARISGLIPLLILIIISISSIRETIKLIKNKRIGLFLRTLVFACMTGMFMQFSTEPILEGIPMLVMFFCLLYGMITQINKSTI